MLALSKNILLGVIGIYAAVGEEVDIIRASATKWDLRDNTDSGCGEVGGEGCEAPYTIDGLLNNVPNSRWSCNDAEIPEEGMPCNITWQLESLQTLDNITIYFYKSNESDRTPNEFNLSISVDGSEFTDKIIGVENSIPLDLGLGDTFSFEAGSLAEYIRLTGINSDEQWLSVCEAKVFGSAATLAPTPLRTSAPTLTPSGAIPLTLQPSSALTMTPAPTPGVGTITPTLTPSHMGPTIAPAPVSPRNEINDASGDGDSDDDSDTRNAIIVGCVCGGVVLLLLAGLGVGYRVRRSRASNPAPPSYDDVVETAS